MNGGVVNRDITAILNQCGLGDCPKSPNPRSNTVKRGSQGTNIHERIQEAVPYILFAGLVVNLFIAWKVR